MCIRTHKDRVYISKWILLTPLRFFFSFKIETAERNKNIREVFILRTNRRRSKINEDKNNLIHAVSTKLLFFHMFYAPTPLSPVFISLFRKLQSVKKQKIIIIICLLNRCLCFAFARQFSLNCNAT